MAGAGKQMGTAWSKSLFSVPTVLPKIVMAGCNQKECLEILGEKAITIDNAGLNVQ